MIMITAITAEQFVLVIIMSRDFMFSTGIEQLRVMYSSNLFHFYLISKYYLPYHKIKPIPDATASLFRDKTDTEREGRMNGKLPLFLFIVTLNILLGFYLVQPSHFWGLYSGAIDYIWFLK